MPAQKYTEHAFIFQDSEGLPSTDDQLMGEKVVNFEFSKLTQKKNYFQLVEKNLVKDNITTLGGYF